ncbi:class I mannose-6-phosphate isomerase [Parasphingorhabdus sp.]|uniref:class I mannose-6-phosphate isomerase n=1 Tax=Parasphingorhabdus sp. TaxID=2709688 RepID=UPI002B270C44|nr:class I mannose-6-phosphate isomerase [Parasphingorhabdus sp.]
MKLKRRFVEKPWGETVLPDIFQADSGKKIGEIWFEAPKGISPQLMIKYLFTSEKLSIQVHPDDQQARRMGFPHGKEESWLILHAESWATLGIGLIKEVQPSELREAIISDKMENLLDWKPVSAGDIFHIPAGTVHAIGPGIVLLEVQQNIDLTYRLYDYGRPRELHIEGALNVAALRPYDMNNHSKIPADQSAMLVDSPYFRIFQIIGDDIEPLTGIEATEWQLISLDGNVKVCGTPIEIGECGICASQADIDMSNNRKAIIACTTK